MRTDDGDNNDCKFFFFNVQLMSIFYLQETNRKKKREHEQAEKNLIKAKVKANRPNWVSVEWFLLKKNFFVVFFLKLPFFFDGRSRIREETKEN